MTEQPTSEPPLSGRGHRCAADHCDRMIPWHLLMCAPDWAHVPRDLQREVHRTYRNRQDNWAAYERAVEAAKEAVKGGQRV